MEDNNLSEDEAEQRFVKSRAAFDELEEVHARAMALHYHLEVFVVLVCVHHAHLFEGKDI